MNQKHAWNIITVFLIMIFGFTAATLLAPKHSFSEKENRSLQTMPAVKTEDILSGRFEKDYEDYLTDQFPARDSWITARTVIDRLMQRKDVHDVYFAAEDYLIEKHSGVFETSLAAQNVRFVGSFFEKLTENYDPQQLTCMVVPNAVDLYADKLPLAAVPPDEEAYLRSVQDALPEGVWFDSSAILRETMQDEQLYYRTDHHWTTPAAFSVFTAWAGKQGFTVDPADYERSVVTDSFQGTISAKVGADIPDDTIEQIIKAAPVSYILTYDQSDDIRSTAFQEQKLLRRGKYEYFYGGNFGLIEGKTKAASGRRILVIKDSYAHCFVPFLYDLYDEVDMIDLRYFTQSLDTWMSEHNYTDVMVLMNAAGFAQDATLNRLLT